MKTDDKAIHGHWPAMMTPVDAHGRVDTARAIAHGRHLLAHGADGLTLFGTSGEGPAFTVSQRQALVEAMLAAGVKPTQLLINITALAIDDAIALGRHALASNISRAMAMPPFFYNQPRDAGVVEAISRIVRGIGDDALRLLLYHFPAQCNAPFSHAAIAELARRHPQQVVGVKDSAANLEQSLALTRAFPRLSILVGCEPHVAAVMLAGGAGSVNGLANVAPRLMRRVIDHPSRVSAEDDAWMRGLLMLLSVRPGMPFVSAYKTMLAEQTGDDAWLHVVAPLDPLDNTEARAVREGYRALGIDPARI